MSEDIKDALRKYLKTPRTVEEMAAFLNVSPRTVFRYLKQLPRVQRVGITRPTKYEVK